MAINPEYLVEGALYQTSCIKVENIAKINKRLAIKPIGILNIAVFIKVIDILFSILKAEKIRT
ncbi:MAG: hypothetical protein ABIA63_11730 [bacterium]